MTAEVVRPMAAYPLRAALDYYRLGFCPVLLHGRAADGRCTCGRAECLGAAGKHPVLEGWPEQAAKAQEADIRGWWTKRVGAHVGLLCGCWAGVPSARYRHWTVVVDVDAKALPDGRTGLGVWSEWLEEELVTLPRTMTARTPSGGLHLFFAHPGVGETILTRAHVLPGVDIRADRNGQVVVWPSAGYVWEIPPEELMPQPMPAEVLELARGEGPMGARQRVVASPPPRKLREGDPSRAERIRRAQLYLEQMPESVSGEGGHEKLWRAALVTVRGFLLQDEADALEALERFNRRCKPPWTEREIRHKVLDAAVRGTMDWGAKLQEGSWRDADVPAKARRRASDEPVDVEAYAGYPEAADAAAGDSEAMGAAPEAAGAAEPERAPMPETDERATQAGWQTLLTHDAHGRVAKTRGNVKMILENSPSFESLCLNTFRGQIWLRAALVVHGRGQAMHWAPRALADADVYSVGTWLEQKWSLVVPSGTIREAIEQLAAEREYHPVRQYLSDLRWDGIVRVPTWLHDFLGVGQSAYAETVGRCWLISAVARAMSPGCKADCLLVLEGEQETLKSTTVRALAGDEWFADELGGEIGSRDASQSLMGKWVIEFSELDNIRRSDVERIKSFLSRQVDHYRAAYARYTLDVARQCVFVGTTNRSQYLLDETGARRFWPVVTNGGRPRALLDVRDQLWAEARTRYEQGEHWWLEEKTVQQIARGEQRDRYVGDPWQERIADYLAGHPDAVIIPEILTNVIGMAVERWTQQDQNRVARCLRLAGYKRVRERFGDWHENKRRWVYQRDIDRRREPIVAPTPTTEEKAGQGEGGV